MELGDIVPPKTSEETIAELMSVVSELRNEIREMKTVQHMVVCLVAEVENALVVA